MIYLQMIQNESDRNSVENIYRNYRSTMLYIAQGILKDRHRAEDAVSQAFIKIIDNLQKIVFYNCNKTRGLVVIIVRNVCFDMLKSEKYMDILPSEDIEEKTNFTENFPLEHVISEESYNRVTVCLSKLNDRYKDILKMKYVYEYTNAETSKMLGISETNVRARLCRARQAFIQEMEKEDLCNGKQ